MHARAQETEGAPFQEKEYILALEEVMPSGEAEPIAFKPLDMAAMLSQDSRHDSGARHTCPPRQRRPGW